MALINTGPGYTQTGTGPLARWANAISLIPGVNAIVGSFTFLKKIPLIGPLLSGPLSFMVGQADTLLEAGSYLLKGQFGSAATAAVAGTVSNSVNALDGTPFWFLNAGSGVLTGATLGTHARMLTEKAIGGVTGALGVKPAVLRSYTAGVGSIGSGAMPTASARAPGQFTTKIANERGQDADAAYANYMGSEGKTFVSPSMQNTSRA